MGSLDTIQFYSEGDDYLEALGHDLAAARFSIYIESYILADDAVGRKIQRLLIEKAAQGVRVKLLIDGIGSAELPDSFLNELKNAGVAVKIYHPLKFHSRFLDRLNKRDHRKLVIIDAATAYLGGMNLHHALSQKHFGEGRWRDTQIRLQGPLVNKLVYHFKRAFKILRFRSRRLERLQAKNDITVSGRWLGRNKIRRLLHNFIDQSLTHIGITCAYFIPDMETILKLIRARKRGASVQIITNGPEHCDVAPVPRINRPLLRFLIKRGVEVYYYQDRMLHAKTAVFDGFAGTVGSANMNYRSFFRDLEINMFFREKKYVEQLRAQFAADLSHSRLVTTAELKNIPWWRRLVDAFWYLLRSFF